MGRVFGAVPVSGDRRSVAGDCNDTLEDLASGTPMDRLICGDVGFGKTEVAMRAAFVAAMSGVQVAVIAPTTLLARQHAASFKERFRGFPVEIRQLSRFVRTKEAEKTRDGLARGTVDIVIGTHAVLAKVGTVPEPWAVDRRRGTALRRRAQGAVEAACAAIFTC